MVKMCWTRSVCSSIRAELLPSSHSHGKRSAEGDENSDHQAELAEAGEGASKNENSIYHNAPKNQGNL